MKISLFILAALLSIVATTPAMAMSEDHDSAYANASGGSKFSDPDDALGGDDANGSANPLGTVQFGNSDGSSGGATLGFSNGSSAPSGVPGGYYGIYDPTRPR